MHPDLPERDLKTFALSALLCFGVIFGLAWLYVIKKPMTYSEMAYPIWLQKMQTLEKHQYGTLAIVGDSQPMADLIPARLGPGVTNFALPGGMPIEAFYVERLITSDSSAPKAVIISFAPTHFMEVDSFWDMGVGFGFLKGNEINEVRIHSRSFRDSLFGTYSPWDFDARLKIFLNTIQFPSYKFAAISRSFLHSNASANKEMLQFVEANRGRGHVGLADGTTELDWNTKVQNFVPEKLLDCYFDKCLSLLQSKNIPVYFLAMPHNASSEAYYNPALKKSFVSYLQHYAEKYSDFHILDDPFPSYEPEYFGDPDHLNEKGAIKWSDHVAALLRQNHIEGGPFVPFQATP